MPRVFAADRSATVFCSFTLTWLLMLLLSRRDPAAPCYPKTKTAMDKDPTVWPPHDAGSR